MRSSPPSYCNRDLPATTRIPARWARATHKRSPRSAWLLWQSFRRQDRRRAAGYRQHGGHAVAAAAHRRDSAARPGVESRIGSRSAPGAGIRSCSHRRHSLQRCIPPPCCGQSAAGISRRTIRVNTVLARWNALPPGEAADEILSCCGARAWAEQLAPRSAPSRMSRVSSPPLTTAGNIFPRPTGWRPSAATRESANSMLRPDDGCLGRLVTIRAGPDE